jgi:hypothetical protein
LDSIKKNIERNKNKILLINNIYAKNNKKSKTIDKKQNDDIYHKKEMKEECEKNIKIRSNFKTINPEIELDNNLYKKINLELNIKNNSEKIKTIKCNTNSEKNLNIKNIMDKKKLNINMSNDSDNNLLVISNNYLLSKLPTHLPKLSLELKDKLNLHLNSNHFIKNCSSSRAIMDKIIEKTKGAIVPKIVKNFYENQKNKGYIPFIANKESNTIFLRKYHKKYNKNIIYTEGNEKILPKIYKHMPLNRNFNPNI